MFNVREQNLGNIFIFIKSLIDTSINQYNMSNNSAAFLKEGLYSSSILQIRIFLSVTDSSQKDGFMVCAFIQMKSL